MDNLEHEVREALIAYETVRAQEETREEMVRQSERIAGMMDSVLGPLLGGLEGLMGYDANDPEQAREVRSQFHSLGFEGGDDSSLRGLTKSMAENIGYHEGITRLIGRSIAVGKYGTQEQYESLTEEFAQVVDAEEVLSMGNLPNFDKSAAFSKGKDKQDEIVAYLVEKARSEGVQNVANEQGIMEATKAVFPSAQEYLAYLRSNMEGSEESVNDMLSQAKESEDPALRAAMGFLGGFMEQAMEAGKQQREAGLIKEVERIYGSGALE